MRYFTRAALLLTVFAAGCSKQSSAGVDVPQMSYWFDAPAESWEEESLPVGNGNIGANVFGGIAEERLTFNEKSLWRGGPNTAQGADYYWDANKQPANLLPGIRQAFLDGDKEKAARLTRENFNGLCSYEASEEDPFRFGNFTTGGGFRIATGLVDGEYTDYCRSLSLDSAKVSVSFRQDGVRYKREYFTSYPDNVLVMGFTADMPGCQNLRFEYIPNPDADGELVADGEGGLAYKGHLRSNNMKYVVRMRVLANGGTVDNADGVLSVRTADEVMFIVTADTDYRINFDPDFGDPLAYTGTDPEATTGEWMRKAAAKDYIQLFDTHYKDYSALYNRVQLRLGDVGAAAVCSDRGTSEEATTVQSEISPELLPVNQRFERYRAGGRDLGLEMLYYQFGRYLLISSSRPGNLPANLQGIWCEGVDGPWHVDYHNNINLQMNYWPACQTNLAECVQPLVDFIRSQQKPGERVARDYYGARGWTTSISSNIFGFASPLSSEDMSWNLCPIAGSWLATHIWEYYDFTRDRDFLKDVGYELIKSSADFVCDYLWQRPDGLYSAAPSTSPEHGPVDAGATFVHAVARELLTDAVEASRVLDCDESERTRWQEVLDKIAPYQTGRYGQLMEWSEDIDDPQDEHRHVNHLFGLHPGHTISPVLTPDLAEAARVVLEHRGDAATGWSMGWKLNQWARLHDGNRAYTLYSNLLKNGTADNCWDMHPPFQIDGNFGGTAGVTEMLLQSHAGFIHILPALPDCWSEGAVSGLCARGGFELGFSWKDGELDELTLLSKAGGPCVMTYGGTSVSLMTEKGHSYRFSYHNGLIPEGAAR